MKKFVTAVVMFACGFGMSRSSFAVDRLVPEQYPTMQAALSASLAGDTVSLAEGYYNAGSLTMPGFEVSLSGRGAPKSTVITGTEILVSSGTGIRRFSNLTLRGFTGYAAIQVNGATVDVQAVVFENNSSHGIFLNTNAVATTKKCVFAGQSRGGYAYVNSTWNAEDCLFEQNSCGCYGAGAGFHVGSGGTFVRCKFVGNSSPQGAAVGLSFGGNRVFDNCLFQWTPASSGPIWWTEFGATGTCKNSTFCGYASQDIAGGFTDGGGNQFLGGGCGLADCNGDGLADYGQILRGELLDLNGNYIPDCCDQGIACPSTANLLENGSLEGYSANCGGFVTIGSGSTAIPGWTVSGANNIDWAADASGNCCRAADGIAYVDLNGSPSQSMGSALRQTVATVIGRQYRLTARVAVNNCCHPAGTLETFRITGGGVTKDFVLTTYADAACNHWELVQLDWTATATSTNVEVRSMVANSAGGIMVDDIRLFELSGVLQVPSQYATIQAAIDAATAGKTVEVSAGTYNEAIDFKGKAITIKAVGARANTIIDGTGKTTSVVRAVTGETAASVLQGFTIRNGTTGTTPAFDPSLRLGGGMYIDHASPAVKDCAFVSNRAGFGGGLYSLYGSPSIESCTFSQNTASTDGGGLQLFGGSAVVRNCSFADNRATVRGGGLHIVQYSDGGAPTVDGCIITGNRADVGEGGGMTVEPYLGASAKPVVSNCTIQSNTSYGRGGGLWGLVAPTAPGPNMRLLNNTICNNTSTISKRENVWALYEDAGNGICDCVSDVDGDKGVDTGDLAFTLLFFGELTDPDFIQPDQDMNGFIDMGDVALILMNFGPCQ